MSSLSQGEQRSVTPGEERSVTPGEERSVIRGEQRGIQGTEHPLEGAGRGANMGSRHVEAAIAPTLLILLLIGCLVVLTPFFSAILWAILLCFSTWGPYLQLRRRLSSHALSALIMTLLLAAAIVVPFVIVGSSLAGNVADMVGVIRQVIERGPADSPSWVRDFPFFGTQLHDYLMRLTHDPATRSDALHSLINPLRTVTLALGKALGHGVFEISLSLLICFFVYRDGDAAAARLDRAVSLIAGQRGRGLLEVASVTTTGVVQGVLGTALIQGVLIGIGLWIAGVPGAFLLGFASFLLSFIPMGPALIWIPAAIWLYQSALSWAIFLAVWSAVAGVLVDHVLKPVLISRTSTTPFLLVIFGVLGGALAFGFIGVFIGPTLLTVGYRLIDEWSAQLAA